MSDGPTKPSEHARRLWYYAVRFLGLLLIIGISSAVFVGYVFPWLAALPGLGFLNQRTPVVVQRVEQVRLSDGLDTQHIYEQIRPATVTVISYRGPLTSLDRTAAKPLVGAGFIVTTDGLIFSSKKLIADPKNTVKVVTDNGRVYDAAIVAFDFKSDLAVLKIAADNLPIIRFDSEQRVQVGDKALTVGSALKSFGSLFQVLTVSQRPSDSQELLRSVSSDELQRFLGLLPQADRHFIGGPIVNRDGRFIGQISEDGGVSADYLAAVLEVYLSRHVLPTGRLNLQYTPIMPIASQLLRLPKAYGALVTSPPNKPAAGSLREGDFIYKMNGREIDAEHSFDSLIQTLLSGDKLQIDVYRAGQTLTLTLTAQ